MNQFAAKLKLIYLPFIFIAAGIIIIYTFLNWLVLIKLNLFKIDDGIINFFIPFFLPWIPLLIWMRPRIKLLKLKVVGRRDPIMGLLFLNWLTIGIPLVIAQEYIITVTGKMTHLDYISQILHEPPTKYYTVKKIYFNKNMVHVRSVYNISGKHKEYFDMTIYAAVPAFDHVFPDTNRIAAIRDSVNAKALIILNGKLSNMPQLKKLPADSIQLMRVLNPSMVMPRYGDSGKYGALLVLTKGYHKKNLSIPISKISPVAWLALKFQRTVDNNNLSVKEKNGICKSFAFQSQMRFNAMQLNKFVYLDRVHNRNDLENYTEAITSRNDVMPVPDPAILLSVNEPFAAHNGHKLAWILGAFGIGAGLFLLILQFIKLNNNRKSA